ncbi:Ferredoxin--NADP reductase [Thalassocella blandensis]|nr:Ferredoxin--NADP reductase [Thalassocella blandensis]
MNFDCIVIGGGAAGLMCAATAGYRGRRVLVIEHSNKVGKKILMSGGGRCNFTNYSIEPGNYISHNAHFCKSALSRFTPSDFIELVERHGLAYHEKTKGQLFCDNKSQDILNILLTECEYAQVEIRTKCSVDSIERIDEHFALQTSIGTLTCSSLVVATGGLSIPTMGASGKGYDIARQFGLQCTSLQASLVPFTLQNRYLQLAQSLAGLSLEVDVSCGAQHFNDPLLFTHRGLSGPAVLQISNYWQKGEEVCIDFLPGKTLSDIFAQAKQDKSKAELKNIIAQHMPKRFVHAWLAEVSESLPLPQYSHRQLQDIAAHFHQWRLVPAGTEGYRTAEVTRGGVSTEDVSSKTFEAKHVAGLYFVGEVLDVTGWLGGFNFQWAWASGYCAGQVI